MTPKKDRKPIVLKGLTGLQLTDEDKKILSHCERNKNVPGPCGCGEPEVERCDLCGGPTCDPMGFCHPCMNSALC